MCHCSNIFQHLQGLSVLGKVADQNNCRGSTENIYTDLIFADDAVLVAGGPGEAPIVLPSL